MDENAATPIAIRNGPTIGDAVLERIGQMENDLALMVMALRGGNHALALSTARLIYGDADRVVRLLTPPGAITLDIRRATV